MVVPDDLCEACGKNVANRECAHGILCDTCDEQVHGSVNGPCDLQPKPGCVCANCGKTVTYAEYDYGESKCCKDSVIPEEQY